MAGDTHWVARCPCGTLVRGTVDATEWRCSVCGEVVYAPGDDPPEVDATAGVVLEEAPVDDEPTHFDICDHATG